MTREPVDPKPFVTPQMAALEEELTQRRAALAATVDELGTRLNPRVQAGVALGRSKRLFQDAVSREAAPEARRRALVVLGAVAAGVVLMAAVGWRRRR